ncbi:M81 family peptidase [Candidimonas sp. SYP-B2681]|uniref:M81 family metallopeptidase n=1 Tax=Candidimonas sp. SYP-B2681 TaxID=2497686 RepID=UPI000F86C5A7|nr:M81 family metallopeptidase [Candidimonas sp. SYP-B2681]RTZ42554.1 M81 family peptidase [Candidimonas sp. SYP-B2681]
MSKTCPKVAILGFHLESNAFAPVSSKEDFLAQCWEEGDHITTLARGLSHLPSEVPGFYQRMDTLGDWTPAPLIVVAAPPGGPASAEVWNDFLIQVEQRLLDALPVDAVYIANHGASSAEHVDDTEKVLMEKIRSILGPDIPVVATYDLHCNVSPETVDALDAVISYRTNPHIDQRERAAEAADLLHETQSGTKLVTAYLRLPLTPPSVTLSSAKGPYADLITLGTSLMQRPEEGPIANVSVAAGFVFSDLPKCGMTITVTARGDLAAARQAALTVARAAWADKGRYVADTVNVEQAVQLAQTIAHPILLADVADNPGGGGRGNTSWLLKALDQARVPGVVLGIFIAPDLAAQAHELGVGAEFDAVFNSEESTYSHRYVSRARVLYISDGAGVGRRGILQGRKFSLGPSALLELTGSGMQVVVGSLRRQLAEPAMLEMHGIDISKANCVVVKSRGHYRAGFDEFFADDRIYDVDSPGLTTPNLRQIRFERLPRPVWPIDDDAVWREPDWATSPALP